MSKLTLYIQSYLLYALPVVLITALWGQFESGSQATGFSGLLWELGSWVLMIWFALLIGFLLILLIYPPVREQTVLRVARIRERDEREEQITGRAARTSFIATMAVLIFLIFISVFKITLSAAPASADPSAPKKTLSLGFGLTLLDETRQHRTGQTLFESVDIPLSKSALLILILILQVGSFRLSVRRQTREDQP